MTTHPHLLKFIWSSCELIVFMRCQGLNIADSLSPLSRGPTHHKSNTVSSVQDTSRANKQQYHRHTPTREQARINYQQHPEGISKEYLTAVRKTAAASLKHHDGWVCKRFYLCFHSNKTKVNTPVRTGGENTWRTSQSKQRKLVAHFGLLPFCFLIPHWNTEKKRLKYSNMKAVSKLKYLCISMKCSCLFKQISSCAQITRIPRKRRRGR